MKDKVNPGTSIESIKLAYINSDLRSYSHGTSRGVYNRHLEIFSLELVSISVPDSCGWLKKSNENYERKKLKKRSCKNFIGNQHINDIYPGSNIKFNTINRIIPYYIKISVAALIII